MDFIAACTCIIYLTKMVHCKLTAGLGLHDVQPLPCFSKKIKNQYLLCLIIQILDSILVLVSPEFAYTRYTQPTQLFQQCIALLR